MTSQQSFDGKGHEDAQSRVLSKRRDALFLAAVPFGAFESSAEGCSDRRGEPDTGMDSSRDARGADGLKKRGTKGDKTGPRKPVSVMIRENPYPFKSDPLNVGLQGFAP